MTITWPDNLPLPIKYGAESEYSRGNKISSEFEYGPKKRRNRFTNAPAYQTIQLRYSDDQIEQFINFYQGVLLEGTVSFWAKVIVADQILSRRCSIDDDTLKIVAEGWNSHSISMVVEIYNPYPYPANSGYAWIIGMYGEDFFIEWMADPLQYEVNVHYPEIMEDY